MQERRVAADEIRQAAPVAGVVGELQIGDA
jgi:hypothetical protein